MFYTGDRKRQDLKKAYWVNRYHDHVSGEVKYICPHWIFLRCQIRHRKEIVVRDSTSTVDVVSTWIGIMLGFTESLRASPKKVDKCWTIDIREAGQLWRQHDETWLSELAAESIKCCDNLNKRPILKQVTDKVIEICSSCFSTDNGTAED